ncbi:LytTR family DNA-binding domain-containing protein [Devosia ginsengisoli]|uniref:LytTR family transcriptional regulator n=1 Tax=Devosia ginsengisoli TaxID=400770 RepID=A0A5B8LVN8_9HYPH|nr:LytTR family DNA-binding domain-containing protein [Devosia ginsengisoli]QDZ11502.1 LytTR family transcriptional regulator [Devosia ginsengisoli]
MRVLATDIRSWVALAVLSLVVGLVGPFGTFAMPVPGRLAYWTSVVFGTAAAGTLFASLGERLLGDRLPPLVGAALAGAIAGLPITLVVMLINAVVYGLSFEAIDTATLLVYCALISAAVTMLSAFLSARASVPAAAEAGPALLERLALPQRGRLLHLAVADHYVEVTTDRGRALLLMRLSDAIRETAPVAGLQVHRSHWVALDAVRKTARQSGKPVLELENGTIIPISRSYLADAKAAGLL